MTSKRSILSNLKFLTFLFIILLFSLTNRKTIFASTQTRTNGNYTNSLEYSHKVTNSKNSLNIYGEASKLTTEGFYYGVYSGYHEKDESAAIYLVATKIFNKANQPTISEFLQLKNPYNELYITKMNNYIRNEVQKYLDTGEFFLSDEDASWPWPDHVARLLSADKYRVSVQISYALSYKIVTFNGAGDVLTLGDIFKVSKEKYLNKMFDLCYEAVVDVLLDSDNDDFLPWYKNDNLLKRDSLLRDFNECMESESWRIGKDAVILYFNFGIANRIIEIPFTELSDILEDGYI